MKTSLKNQYAQANQVLIAIVSAVLGYNIYQAMMHPENSHLILSIALVALTYVMIQKFGYKTTPEKGQQD
ncbi:hypothetical protein [Chryseobacterium polytrichastri]|uniref:Uncharacterized protein n=1 Tax=Chryseobacterium polytrichastri TaxID=1302687 RepID=A0A1M7EW56_9FLAO|nr:hypothetical protein [Chryseobacterium polytrichastri]SHL95921.1 hypothetical protein SAMN05444267_102954 [Chryseobacterium polytrichastri]